MKKKIFLIFALAVIVFPQLSLAEYKTEIGLPALPKGSVVSNPGQYIQSFFTFGLYLAAFLSVGFIAIGGLLWILAAGNPGRIDKAKEMIVAALSGLVLLLCSWLILNTIDPSMTNISAPSVSNLQKAAENNYTGNYDFGD